MTDAPIARVQYTNADFRTLRQELLARIPFLTSGKWSDLNESDIGIAIVELLIGMQDQNLFYLDKKFLESQLPTARQRVNVKNLLKLIAYDVPGYVSASGQVTISVAPSATPPAYGTVNGHANSILIPLATELSGRSEVADAVSFYTIEDRYLTQPQAGASGAVTVGVIQGQRLTSPETFQGDGTANQRYVLRVQNVARDLLTVKIGSTENSAIPWVRVTTFLTSKANDQIFEAVEDEKGNVYIQFGDGKFGKVPPLGQNIYVYAVITLGTTGNLAAGTVTQVTSSVLDTNGSPVSLTASNVQAMTGGADPETIEIAKRNGPAQLSALFRAMSKRDYIALAQLIQGVDKANAWGEQEELHPNIKLFNRVMVTFLALDSNGNLIDPLSPEYAVIRSQVSTLLEERKPVTTRVVFEQPQWVDLIVSTQVAVDRTLYDENIIASEAKLAVQDYFSYVNVTFGQDARQSLVSKLLLTVPGVSWATVQLAQRKGSTETAPSYGDIPVSRWELIRINDFDQQGNPVLGTDASGKVIEHVRIFTTTQVDAPTPDFQTDESLSGVFPSGAKPFIETPFGVINDVNMSFVNPTNLAGRTVMVYVDGFWDSGAVVSGAGITTSTSPHSSIKVVSWGG